MRSKTSIRHSIMLSLIIALTILSSTISHSYTIYYRRNDYFTYRVTGSVWIKTELTNTTIVNKTKTTVYVEYSAHIHYTKHYNYTLSEVGVVKYANETYILVRGNRSVQSIKIHSRSESSYASQPDILRKTKINYIDFITCPRITSSNLTILSISDAYSNTVFEQILKYKPNDLLKLPSGSVSSIDEACRINNVLIHLSDNSLIIVYPEYSGDYVERNYLKYGVGHESDYIDLKYDLLLRYFNGALVYGSVTVYGDQHFVESESNGLKSVELTRLSKLLYSIEIELIDTSVEEIPKWRSLRIDLIYLITSGNVLENSLLVFILILTPILSLYILYRKLTSTRMKRELKIVIEPGE